MSIYDFLNSFLKIDKHHFYISNIYLHKKAPIFPMKIDALTPLLTPLSKLGNNLVKLTKECCKRNFYNPPSFLL